jgi:hypothetical protein
MHGKMGISILFYHLSRKYNNKIYEEYAGELVDEIYEEINPQTPVDFENGLAGIGWGIEYLVQNGFIVADTNDVLSEFDERIFHELIYNLPTEINLLNGILGIGAYFLKRIQNNNSDENNIYKHTNKKALDYTLNELDKKTKDISSIFEEPTNENVSEKNKLKPIFDLSWNLFVLILFLSDVHKNNLETENSNSIIDRAINAFSSPKYFPKLFSNQLLFNISFLKIAHFNKKKLQSISILDQVLDEINSDEILAEIENNNNLRFGKTGIALIFELLFKITSESKLEIEKEHWLKLINSTEENTFSLEQITTSNTSLGVLEGRAGFLILDHIVKP